LFGQPTADVSDDASDGHTGSTRKAGNAADVISETVQLGYRVIDDYIKQAQKVADRIGRRSYGPDEMTADLQDVAGRMMQYASDFFRVWTELVGMAMSGAATSPRSEPAPVGASQGGETTASQGARSGLAKPSADDRDHRRSRISVDIESTRRTEVSLDVEAIETNHRLVVYPLRATDPNKPELRDLTVSNDRMDRPVCIRVRIPDDQPAGRYHGLVVDETTGKPLGSISVQVFALEQSRRGPA
jgi:hypothetical protein